MIKKTAPGKFETRSHFIILVSLLIFGFIWFITLGYEPLYINGKKYGGWKDKL